MVDMCARLCTRAGLEEASMNSTEVMRSDLCQCGKNGLDHCPKCSACDCAITRGMVHRNTECAHVLRQGILKPFQR
jgi:hypothetical protein